MDMDKRIRAAVVHDLWTHALSAKHLHRIQTLWPWVSEAAKADAFAMAVRFHQNDDDGFLTQMLQSLDILAPPPASREFLGAALAAACDMERLEAAARLIQKGASVHADDDAALLRAVDRAQPRVVAFLLAHNADPAARDGAAVKMALERRDWDMAETMLRANAAYPPTQLETFLKMACEPPVAHPDVVRSLLQKGADAAAVLVQAVDRRDLALLQLIFENATTSLPKLALDDALVRASRHPGNVEALRLLIRRGARVLSDTIFHVQGFVTDPVMLSVLVSNWAEFRTWGRFCLSYAVGDGDVATTKVFLKHGADPNARDEDGVPVLCVAARASTHARELVKVLVDAGADVHMDNDQALHEAAMAGNIGTVQFLLAVGARIEARGTHDQDIISAVGDRLRRLPPSTSGPQYAMLAFLLGKGSGGGGDLRPFLRSLRPEEAGFRAQFLHRLFEQHPVAVQTWYDRCAIGALPFFQKMRLFGTRRHVRSLRKVVNSVRNFLPRQPEEPVAEASAVGYAPMDEDAVAFHDAFEGDDEVDLFDALSMIILDDSKSAGVEDAWRLALSTKDVFLLKHLWPMVVDAEAKADAFVEAVYAADAVAFHDAFQEDDDNDTTMLDELLAALPVLEPPPAPREFLTKAFYLACSWKRLDLAERLLGAGAFVDGNDTMDPLTYAAWKGDADVVAFLLAHGADPTARQSSAAHYAVRYRHVKIAQMLFEANPHHFKLKEMLLEACKPTAHLGLVRLILRAGADVREALWWSVYVSSNVPLMRVLLEGRERDTELRPYLGNLLRIELRQKRPSEEVVRILLQYGAVIPEDSLADAVRANLLPMVRILIEHGADVRPHVPALWWDILRSIPLLDMCLEYGMDPNTRIRFGASDQAILSAAAALHDMEVVQKLVAAGADPRVDNDDPLHEAAMAGNVDTVQYFLDLGARLDSVRRTGIDVTTVTAASVLSLMDQAHEYEAIDGMEGLVGEKIARIRKCLAFLLSKYRVSDLRPFLEILVGSQHPLHAAFVREMVGAHPLAVKVWYDRCGLAALPVEDRARLLGDAELVDVLERRFYLLDKLDLSPDMVRELAAMGYLGSGTRVPDM